jgi:hypothetical protein
MDVCHIEHLPYVGYLRERLEIELASGLEQVIELLFNLIRFFYVWNQRPFDTVPVDQIFYLFPLG